MHVVATLKGDRLYFSPSPCFLYSVCLSYYISLPMTSAIFLPLRMTSAKRSGFND